MAYRKKFYSLNFGRGTSLKCPDPPVGFTPAYGVIWTTFVFTP